MNQDNPNNSGFSDSEPHMGEFLDNLLEADGLFSMFFGVMNIAEEAQRMIEAFIRQYPHRADVLWDAFKTVHPHASLLFEECVWQSHIHELLQRVVHGLDLSAPTTAEMAAWMVGTLLNEGEIEEGHAPDLSYAMGRLVQQPPYKIAELLEHAPRMERHQPNPKRWYETVSLEVKLHTLNGVEAPPEVLTRATWEDEVDIMEAS